MYKKAVTIVGIDCINLGDYLSIAKYNQLVGYLRIDLQQYCDMYALKMNKSPKLATSIQENKLPIKLECNSVPPYTFQFLNFYNTLIEDDFKKDIINIFDNYFYNLTFVLLNTDNTLENYICFIDNTGKLSTDTKVAPALLSARSIISQRDTIYKTVMELSKSYEVNYQCKQILPYLSMVKPKK